jgi:hypothetical protein
VENNVNRTICDAVAELAVIEFSYRGLSRIAEPYCHGISRAGNEVLRAYQVQGDSESNDPFGWRLYEVNQMSGLRKTDATFEPARLGYNPNDSQMTSIHCKVRS